jgi:hypothetical protein
VARVLFVPDKAGQAEVLHSPSGPVGRHLLVLGNRLQRLARRDVGKKTGQLARSIGVQLVPSSTGLMVRVGSSNKIAHLHHEGTRAHIIVPRHAQALVFRMNGRLVFAQRVKHPGTRANRYLSSNLVTVVRDS